MKIGKMQASEIIEQSCCGQGLLVGVTKEQLVTKVKAIEKLNIKQYESIDKAYTKILHIVSDYEEHYSPAKLKRELNELYHNLDHAVTELTNEKL